MTEQPSRALQPAEEPSLGQLFANVTHDVSVLMHQEVELAKAELRQSGSQAGKGIGMFAGAAVGGFLALLFLSVALWWALGTLIGLGWSGVVVAVLWAIAAAALAVVGRNELRRIRGLPQTAETISKIPNALQGKEEENR